MSVKISAIVITVSDACSRGEREDASGAALVELLRETGATIVETKVVPDDLDLLADLLREYAEREDVNLIITTGGTGFAPRDNTPEATLAVIERESPGLPEAMRMET
jgi:molybdopterin adenylyltransferase